MRRVRIVLQTRVRSAVPRHCVVTHNLGTTTARIIARDLSENKTLRFHSRAPRPRAAATPDEAC
jgi:hypothetical protein